MGQANIQGEEQQKLDWFANERFKAALAARGEVCGLASEEEEQFVSFESLPEQRSKYVVLIDPLDGSSNIDVNVAVGTIFSIYRRVTAEGGPVQLADFLQPGHRQVAAGYIIYGSSTMLVYSTGQGVNGFTLDPSIGCFCLSHPEIRIPAAGRTYSVNEGNYLKFPAGVKHYLKLLSGRGCREWATLYLPLYRLAGFGFSPQPAQGGLVDQIQSWMVAPPPAGRA